MIDPNVSQHTLLAPYLSAIGKHLPLKRKDDILAELGANLQAEMDDREEAAGRPLTREEQAEILRAHGHPFEVAMRYQPQRQLIGQLFPFYWYALQRGAPLVAVVFTLVQMVLPAAVTDGVSFWHRLMGLPKILFLFWAVTTAVFAVLDYTMATYRGNKPLVGGWDPLKLPEQEQKPVMRGVVPKYPIVDLISDALFTAWLLAVPRFPVLIFFGLTAHWFPVETAPIWQRMFVPIVALLVCRLVLKAMALDSHQSARRMGLLYVAADVCSAVALALLVLPGEALFRMSNQMSPRVLDGIQFGIMVGLKMALVLAVISAGWKLWQTLRLSGPADGVRGTAVML